MTHFHDHDADTNDNIRVLTAHEGFILASTMHVVAEAGKEGRIELVAAVAAIDALAENLAKVCAARLTQAGCSEEEIDLIINGAADCLTHSKMGDVIEKR